jgi:hypothetical protein
VPTEAEKLRAKLAELLAAREALGLEMNAAAMASGGIDRKTAEAFALRLEHVDMWVESFLAQLRMLDDD